MLGDGVSAVLFAAILVNILVYISSTVLRTVTHQRTNPGGTILASFDTLGDLYHSPSAKIPFDYFNTCMLAEMEQLRYQARVGQIGNHVNRRVKRLAAAALHSGRRCHSCEAEGKESTATLTNSALLLSGLNVSLAQDQHSTAASCFQTITLPQRRQQQHALQKEQHNLQEHKHRLSIQARAANALDSGEFHSCSMHCGLSAVQVVVIVCCRHNMLTFIHLQHCKCIEHLCRCTHVSFLSACQPENSIIVR